MFDFEFESISLFVGGAGRLVGQINGMSFGSEHLPVTRGWWLRNRERGAAPPRRAGGRAPREKRKQERKTHPLISHPEPLVKGVDVAQVAARDDDPVGHLPVELLHDLHGGRLLPLKPERVHRVGQVDGRLGGHLFSGFSNSNSILFLLVFLVV